jgi:hypothetical protein
MFIDNEIAKMQYEIDKKNEKIIDEELNEITRHIKDIEDITKLKENVRKYREKIYEIKLELENELSDIYQTRKNEELTEMEKRTNEDKEVIINSGIENCIYDIGSMNKICKMSLKNHMYLYTNLIKILEDSINISRDMEFDNYDGENGCITSMDINITARFRNYACNWGYGWFVIKKDKIEEMKNDNLKDVSIDGITNRIIIISYKKTRRGFNESNKFI